MEIKEYRILKSTDEKSFENAVNNYLKSGWILYGELKVVMKGAHMETIVYIRELVKIENE